MNYRENAYRIEKLQPHVPDWCKAERMEQSVPQRELWHLSVRPSRKSRFAWLKSRLKKVLTGRAKWREAFV